MTAARFGSASDALRRQGLDRPDGADRAERTPGTDATEGRTADPVAPFTSVAATAGATEPGSASAPGPAATLPGHAVVVLSRTRPSDRAWALWCLVRGERGIGAAPGLRFARAMGSGRDGGFGIAPSLRHQGLIAFFDRADQATRFAERADAVRARLSRSEEALVTVLAVASSRGSWDGQRLQPAADAPPPGQPVAALTRATVRAGQALRFWRRTPDSERALAATPGCRVAAGLGEAPLLRQATFSVWDDTAAMTRYARQGAHGDAARQALSDGWFSEWMFVRFVPSIIQGSWHGHRFG